jgi:tripartite-type tricarboxylate transporter receptor subunit TctC
MDLRHLTAAALLAASGTAALAAAPAKSGAAYPERPIRLIVAFEPGGSTDIIARLVGVRLAERLGQQVVVDNRGGAGGTIGTEIAARSPADGYTLTMGTTSTHVIAPVALPNVRYDPLKDFTPTTLVASTPYLLVLNPGVKANNLKDFVALLKSQPGKLNYASAGAGSTTHLAMEMLKQAASVDIVHVPYKGNGPAGTATIAGQVQALFGSMPAVLPHAKVRGVAVAGLLRARGNARAHREPPAGRAHQDRAVGRDEGAIRAQRGGPGHHDPGRAGEAHEVGDREILRCHQEGQYQASVTRP